MLTDEEPKLVLKILSGDSKKNKLGESRSISFSSISAEHTAKQKGVSDEG